MDQRSNLPKALRVVAAIQLVLGVLAGVGMVVRLAQGDLYLDLGLLGIPIYFGLLRLSSGWRKCALVFVWIGMAVAILVFVLGIVGEMPTHFQIYGIKLASVEAWWATVAAIPHFLFCWWQYRVLDRADVRALFS